MDEIVEHAWFISIVGDFLTCSVLTGPLNPSFSPNNRLTRSRQYRMAVHTRSTLLPSWLRAGLPGPDWYVYRSERASRLSANSSKGSFREPVKQQHQSLSLKLFKTSVT